MEYLYKQGFKQTRYQNPADILLKLAIQPTLIHENLTIDILEKQAKDHYVAPSKEYEEYIYNNHSV